MSASNAKLYILDHPEFDPDWMTNVPKLIKWTEDYFVFQYAPGEPATQWGANIVGEQDCFLVKWIARQPVMPHSVPGGMPFQGTNPIRKEPTAL